MKKYSALYLAHVGPEKCLYDKVFSSREQAAAYIRKRLCPSCEKALAAGHDVDMSHPGGAYKIKDVLDTACGSEWLIEEIDDDPLVP